MSADVVQFGEGFEVDRVAYEVRRSGRALKLERIPMEILLLLLDRRGQLVGREEIIEKIWGKDVFLDTDNSINSAIRKIRQVLKDDPENPVFIQTVTGKGYRFIAVVTEMQAPPAAEIEVIDPPIEFHVLPTQAAVPGPVTPGPITDLSLKGRGSWTKKRLLPAIIAAGVLVSGVGIYVLGVRPRLRSEVAPRRVMLAVLPFVNLSEDREQEYFSDGLTEETIADLGELNPDQLGVIARTSSATYKHTDKTITQIGHELGVDYVLEGSVRQGAGAARVSAQLIRVKDQANLWAHAYDREAGAPLALQNELGRAIAQQVQVELNSSYGNRPVDKYAPNPEAYQLYLKGRFYLNKRTWPELPESADFFQKAIDKDPGFALAYAGLADSYLSQAIGSQQQFDPKAKAAASRALELDDGLADAHSVLGSEKADFEYDWPGAEREFKRAIELDPNNADVHYRYAWHYLTPLGKSEEAIAEMQKALALDPFSRIDNTIFGCVLFYGRKYDRAQAQFAKAIQMNPDFFVTYYHAAWLYSQIGQYPKAIEALTKGRLVSGDARAKIASTDEVALRKAFAAGGSKGFWEQIEKNPDSGEFGPSQIYARLGDKEKALQGLESIYAEREALGTLVNVDPAFDSIRSDARFQSLVRRMGLTAAAGHGEQP